MPARRDRCRPDRVRAAGSRSGLILAGLFLLAVTASAVPESGRGPELEIRAAPRLRDLAERLAQRIPPAWTRVHERLGLAPRDAELVFELVPSIDELRARVAAESGGSIDAWAVGVALPFQDWLGMRHDPSLPYDLATLERVLDHELVHLALGGLDPAAYRELPRWFHEGVAQWCTDEAYYGDVMDLYMASRFGELLPFRDLTETFPTDPHGASLAYQQSLSFVRYLSGISPEPFVPSMIRRVAAGERFEEALVGLMGRSRVDLEGQWQERVRSDPTLLLRFLRERFFFVILVLLVPLLGLALIRQARRRRRLREQWDEEANEIEDEDRAETG